MPTIYSKSPKRRSKIIADRLNQAILRNRKKLNRLYAFLRKYKSYQDHAEERFMGSVASADCCVRERIRLTFISAMAASGGSNLQLTGKACQIFEKRIQRLRGDRTVPFSDFLACFGAESVEDLRETLSNGSLLPNMRHKKTAIFLKKLHWLQTHRTLFTGYKVTDRDLPVPFDSVIVFILNKILKLSAYNLEYHRDFELLRETFLRELEDEHQLIESIWFWGFFSTKGSLKKREFKFNEAKFYSSDFIEPTKKLEKLIYKFMEIVRG